MGSDGFRKGKKYVINGEKTNNTMIKWENSKCPRRGGKKLKKPGEFLYANYKTWPIYKPDNVLKSKRTSPKGRKHTRRENPDEGGT